eukprot:scaffold14634_cov61-Phaeocystis_antarctica.AAC.2
MSHAPPEAGCRGREAAALVSARTSAVGVACTVVGNAHRPTSLSGRWPRRGPRRLVWRHTRSSVCRAARGRARDPDRCAHAAMSSRFFVLRGRMRGRHERRRERPARELASRVGRLRPLQVARKEDSNGHVRRTASPRSRLRREMPELIKQALATEPIRFCAALLITPPRLAVSGGPGRPSLTSDKVGAVSFLTPPPFMFQTFSDPTGLFHIYFIVRHLEGEAASTLSRATRSSRGRLKLSRATRSSRGRLELSRATRLSRAASSYLERPRYLEPPRVVTLSSYPEPT